MHDGVGGGNDNHQPDVFAAASDPKVLVATTVAALLLAGSAYVWRKGSGVLNPAHSTLDGAASTSDTKGKDSGSTTGKSRLRRDATGKGKSAASETRGAATAQGGKLTMHDASEIDDADDLGDPAGGGKSQDASANALSKSARAKERRRRGKDPMKELMKPGGGKLAKILKATDAPSSSGTSALTPTSLHPRTSSQALRRASTSHQETKGPSEDSSASHNAESSSSSTTVPHDPFTSESLFSPASTSSFSQPNRSRSRSRSRSRPRSHNDTEHAAYGASTSKNNASRNSDAASTISSASSSTTTEATTVSSSSTAPSSLASSTSGDAGATPKAEFGRESNAHASASISTTSPTAKRGRQHHDPWDWDGVGSASKSPVQSPLLPSTATSKSRASSSVNSSGTEGTPIPYSSVASAKSPKKEDNRSTVGVRAETREDYHSSSSFVRDAETLDEEEEEVAPLVFPTLNNPAPDSSSSASSYSVGPASTASSSLSRPHSRASSSSGASSSQQYTGKGAGRGVNSSNLAPFSTMRTGTPPLGGGNGGARRVPTPLGSTSSKRPATPVGGPSASSPLLSANPVPPSPSSQSFGHTHSSSPNFGGGSAISAQTQVASLRGALEASRLREQKQKEEVEKAIKEKEALQWENAAWRRREAELQGQVQQMMHQLQSYAAYFSSVNATHRPPHMPPPHPPASSSSNNNDATNPPADSSSATSEEISARDGAIDDHADGTTPKDAGENLGGDDNDNGNDTCGGNSDGEKASGGDGEGSTVRGPSASVPDGSSASPANGEGEVESVPEAQESSSTGGEASGITSAHPHPPPPIVPPPYNPTLAHVGAGPMSPSILHSPMGGFPHYPLHATPSVGFGPHGHPMAFPFHMPSPLPLLPHQQHPFASPFGGSAPQSPGGMMMHPPPHHNPFVVTPNVFHRPGTPGSAGGVLTPHTVPPHPHNPVGMGMGMGLAGSSPYGGGASGSASPDPTSSPSGHSATTAFLMQDRGRRRMSTGAAAGSSGLARSARGVGSSTVLPLDGGIGRRSAGGKGSYSSGSSADGEDVPEGEREGEEGQGGEEEGGFNELLAESILKRPESIRMGAGASRKASFRRDSAEVSPSAQGGGMGGGSVSLDGLWGGYGGGGASIPVGDLEEGEGQNVGEGEEEEQREFVFPSLMGPAPGAASEKRVNGVVSLSASPMSSPPPLSLSSPTPRPSSSLGTLTEEDNTSEVTISKSDSAPS